jgi:PKD repeat protein
VTFSTDVGSLASGGSIVVPQSLGEARDTLTVTAQDLNAVSTQFTVGAQTTGSAGEQLQATSTISVSGRPPIADFTATNLPACTVEFDGTVSSGTAPLTYSWNFGDQTTGVGAKPNHIYTGCTDISEFPVTLSVSNSFGSDTVIKNVSPRP